jgi:hypothetical protein
VASLGLAWKSGLVYGRNLVMELLVLPVSLVGLVCLTCYNSVLSHEALRGCS